LQVTQSHSLAPSISQEVIVARCLEAQKTLEIIFLSFPKREKYVSSKLELKYFLHFLLTYLITTKPVTYKTTEKVKACQSLFFLLHHH